MGARKKLKEDSACHRKGLKIGKRHKQQVPLVALWNFWRECSKRRGCARRRTRNWKMPCHSRRMRKRVKAEEERNTAEAEEKQKQKERLEQRLKERKEQRRLSASV